MMTGRIGITQRVVRAAGSNELRDALAQDWARFFERTLPSFVWVPLPNIGAGIARYAERLGLGGVVLSGGDDIGVFPDRDLTETTLLNHCARNELPALGVCRGMQMMVHVGGGTLRRCESQAHVATRHTVRVSADAGGLGFPTGTAEVNSFHDWVVPGDGLPIGWRPLAWSADGCLEALRSADGLQLGIMWHPEREATAVASDVEIFHRHFFR